MQLTTKLNLKSATILFIWAYIIVTILAYSISIAAAMIFKLPSAQELGLSLFEDPAFVMTIPYHLLINALIWTLFSYIYFRKNKNRPNGLSEAIYLSAFWLVFAMLVDLVGFVLIKSPVSLTPHQFYIEYQPWISYYLSDCICESDDCVWDI